MEPERLKVILAEDSPLLREGLVGLLTDAGHDVIASAATAGELLAAVHAQLPDIVITDVRMPPDHTDEGLRAAMSLRVTYPSLPILVLSQYVSTSYLPDLMDSTGPAGVGYLLKDRVGRVADFLDALTRVATGEVVIDSEVVRQLLGRGRRGSPLDTLTPREREVLALMAEGRTNGSIAHALVVTDAAVRKHVGRIFAKLGLRDDGSDRRVTAVLTYLQNS